ncbi:MULTISPECIES: DUF1476 domain-containing protein [Nitrospirillum]|uniref:DUF1476 domain-containing protein n=1 Tax=Nitrospirillum amazonense TaxID=28077 RepID=A0A560FIX6_9PROT|nr:MULTISPECIES: DUF1476 domain-containing protein [Nitrospirillum]MDG3440111.1 DUF1476 domain-containing protein [Nitrospirillum amazonense]MEA1649883.1 DUF1476 domain-containing protein [Nitrospirillum sp. BR 11164]MEC4593469.1 DUF1476 domain-containing protein [Nitrospirillum amazonense]TWB21562.1 hypothetical protein FBZ88_11878 [Nitrospirillum amazonense]TWB75564.1 hypothetical protein FBZ87_104674 [Nitrospirillum amazonense]
MTTFDEREQAFEAKFKHDEELLFRIYVRRARLMGEWAAQHLGLTGDEAAAYAKEMVSEDLREPGHQDVLARIMADFTAKGVDISAHRVEKEMEHTLEVAREQMMTA